MCPPREVGEGCVRPACVCRGLCPPRAVGEGCARAVRSERGLSAATCGRRGCVYAQSAVHKSVGCCHRVRPRCQSWQSLRQRPLMDDRVRWRSHCLCWLLFSPDWLTQSPVSASARQPPQPIQTHADSDTLLALPFDLTFSCTFSDSIDQ